ncbi:MAG: L,D-transpeptidase family protein [Flavisolibacter sp.]
MKTAIFLSCLIVGGSALTKDFSSKKTLSFPSLTTHTSRHVAGTMPVGAVSIVISKSKYELYVYDSKGWYATYPVVFGNSSLADKAVEGDRNTPEGSFRIVNKRVHDKWDRYMGLDYPTPETLARFNERKRRGEIPASARPGAGIGIHGVWPHEDFVIDRYKNWTDGCISLKNGDIEDLYNYVPIGTPVTIRK